MNVQPVVGILFSLLFSALFSGIEIAFISSNKLHIELQKKRGVYSGIILSSFLKNPSGFIGTTLIGNTIALVLYGIFMADLLEPILIAQLVKFSPPVNVDAAFLILQTLISTFIVLITAEFLPKSIFLINPDKLLALFAIPMRIIYYLMYPLVFVVVSVSKFIITHIFRVEYMESRPVFNLTDLNNYINSIAMADKEVEPEIDTKIFNNAMGFKTIRVRECMIPRTEIAAVEVEDSIEDLRNAFVSSGHSKILVYRETIDDIIGYCHALSLFKKPKDITSILSPVIIVAETMLVSELMVRFIGERKTLALVVDEFGGTSGLISIEDVMEQIFGEIQDEYDQSEDWKEQQVDERTYFLSARHEIDYLNEKYGWELPEGDYDTLGGLIIAVNKDIPRINDVIELPPFTFTVTSMEDARIDTVKLTIAENTEDE
jgi:putative hemolysin